MKTPKQRVTIWLSPAVKRHLKLQSALHDVPIGDVIEASLKLYLAAHEPSSERSGKNGKEI